VVNVGGGRWGVFVHGFTMRLYFIFDYIYIFTCSVLTYSWKFLYLFFALKDINIISDSDVLDTLFSTL
jgi:hypothetical protein